MSNGSRGRPLSASSQGQTTPAELLQVAEHAAQEAAKVLDYIYSQGDMSKYGTGLCLLWDVGGSGAEDALSSCMTASWGVERGRAPTASRVVFTLLPSNIGNNTSKAVDPLYLFELEVSGLCQAHGV